MRAFSRLTVQKRGAGDNTLWLLINLGKARQNISNGHW